MTLRNVRESRLLRQKLDLERPTTAQTAGGETWGHDRRGGRCPSTCVSATAPGPPGHVLVEAVLDALPVADRAARRRRHRPADQLRVARGRRRPRRRARPRRRRRRLLRARPAWSAATPAPRAMIDAVRASCPAASDRRCPPTTPCRSADGTRWYHLQASRVDQAGHVVVTHTDVTARVEAEQRRALAGPARPRSPSCPTGRACTSSSTPSCSGPAGPPSPCSSSTSTASRTSTTPSATRSATTCCASSPSGWPAAPAPATPSAGSAATSSSSSAPTATPTAPRRWPQRFQSSFDEPFDLGGRVARLTASIGVATAAAGDTARALHRPGPRRRPGHVRGEGRRPQPGPDVQPRAAVGRRSAGVLVAAELREAIEAGQLVLHYQPIAAPAHRRGRRASRRWCAGSTPSAGCCRPAEFIPLAEQHGLIAPLTRWVLRTRPPGRPPPGCAAGLHAGHRRQHQRRAPRHRHAGGRRRRGARPTPGLPPEQLVARADRDQRRRGPGARRGPVRRAARSPASRCPSTTSAAATPR